MAQLSDDDHFRDDDWPERSDERARHIASELLARRYVDRAVRAERAGRPTDALLFYASALRHNPRDEAVYPRLFEAAMRRFRESSGEHLPLAVPMPTAVAVARFDGERALDRFVAAALAWALHLDDHDRAVIALERAAAAGLDRFGQWHAPHVYLALWQSGVSERAPWRRAEDACAAVQAWDWVVRIVDVLATLPDDPPL